MFKGKQKIFIAIFGLILIIGVFFAISSSSKKGGNAEKVTVKKSKSASSANNKKSEDTKKDDVFTQKPDGSQLDGTRTITFAQASAQADSYTGSGPFPQGTWLPSGFLVASPNGKITITASGKFVLYNLSSTNANDADKIVVFKASEVPTNRPEYQYIKQAQENPSTSKWGQTQEEGYTHKIRW